MENLTEPVNVGAFASEITNISSEVGKIKALMGVIDEKYGVLDTQAPSSEERHAYERGCGKLYAFIGLIDDCVNRIDGSIEPLAREV